MVAEVMLYWIIYESCSTAQVDLPKTQTALHEWRQEWKFLFGRSFPFHFILPLMLRQINQGLNSFKWASTLLNYLSTTKH